MECDLNKPDSNFGARSAATILLAVLVGELLDDLLVSALMNAWMVDVPDPIALVMKRSITGLLGPCLMFGITIGLLATIFRKCSVTGVLKYFGLVHQTRASALFTSFLAGVVLILIIENVLMVAFPPPAFAAEHPANIVNSGSVVDKLIFVLSAVVLAPITEEFLFRGVLYSGFATSFNKLLAAILVTVCFVLVHPETISTGYWLTHTVLYLTAVILMLLRLFTGALVIGIAFHSGVNFSIVLL